MNSKDETPVASNDSADNNIKSGEDSAKSNIAFLQSSIQNTFIDINCLQSNLLSPITIPKIKINLQSTTSTILKELIAKHFSINFSSIQTLYLVRERLSFFDPRLRNLREFTNLQYSSINLKKIEIDDTNLFQTMQALNIDFLDDQDLIHFIFTVFDENESQLLGTFPLPTYTEVSESASSSIPQEALLPSQAIIGDPKNEIFRKSSKITATVDPSLANATETNNNQNNKPNATQSISNPVQETPAVQRQFKLMNKKNSLNGTTTDNYCVYADKSVGDQQTLKMGNCNNNEIIHKWIYYKDTLYICELNSTVKTNYCLDIPGGNVNLRINLNKFNAAFTAVYWNFDSVFGKLVNTGYGGCLTVEEQNTLKHRDCKYLSDGVSVPPNQRWEFVY